MTGADIFTWVMIIVSASTLLFAIMLVLPGVVECIADTIIELKWSIDKLKCALRGDEDGK